MRGGKEMLLVWNSVNNCQEQGIGHDVIDRKKVILLVLFDSMLLQIILLFCLIIYIKHRLLFLRQCLAGWLTLMTVRLQLFCLFFMREIVVWRCVHCHSCEYWTDRIAITDFYLLLIDFPMNTRRAWDSVVSTGRVTTTVTTCSNNNANVSIWLKQKPNLLLL